MSSTGALLQKFGARRSDRPATPPQEGRGVEMSPPVARQAEPRPQGGRRCSAADAKSTPGTTLRDKAEALIVRGKEQGYLTPDDIRSTFQDLEAEPDQIPRVFAAFQDLAGCCRTAGDADGGVDEAPRDCRSGASTGWPGHPLGLIRPVGRAGWPFGPGCTRWR